MLACTGEWLTRSPDTQIPPALLPQQVPPPLRPLVPPPLLSAQDVGLARTPGGTPTPPGSGAQCQP